MSDFSKLFKPNPLSMLPTEKELNANIEHPPITTRKGRVVYNRKPHYFDKNDLERVAKNVLMPEFTGTKAEGLELLIQKITIWMMEIILDRITFGTIEDGKAEEIYYSIWSALNAWLSKMTPKQVSAVMPEDKDTQLV